MQNVKIDKLIDLKQSRVNAIMSVILNGNKNIKIESFRDEIWAMQFIQYKRGQMSRVPPMWKLIQETISEALTTPELNDVGYILDVALNMRIFLMDEENTKIKQILQEVGSDNISAIIGDFTIVMIYEYMCRRYPENYTLIC